MTAGPTDPQQPPVPPAPPQPAGAHGSVPTYAAPPAGPPTAASFGTPVTASTLPVGVGILGAVVAAAAISAVYGLIFAESNTVVSYILIIGGIVTALILAKTSLPPIARAATAAVLIGGFGFAAILYGGYGQIAKQLSDDTGQHVSFGTAVDKLSAHDVLSNLRGSTWVFFAIAIIASFAYGMQGGARRRRVGR